MGICGSEENVIDVVWFVHFFGVECSKGTIIWYDDTVDSYGRGRLIRKKV